MTLEDTLKTWNYGSNYAKLDRLHAELDSHKDLHNICSFFHVKFIRDLEVND